jgi:hypothetical protein
VSATIADARRGHQQLGTAILAGQESQGFSSF